jgi:hypothetical protein
MFQVPSKEEPFFNPSQARRGIEIRLSAPTVKNRTAFNPPQTRRDIETIEVGAIELIQAIFQPASN